MIIDKPFTTLEEQYKILTERGLHCQDKEQVKKYFLFNNYYNVNVINGYGHFLLATNNLYFNTAAFGEVIAIRQFDNQFKSTLLKATLDIENYFKSVIAYEFSKKFSNKPFAYLDRTNYANDHFSDVSKTVTDLNKIIEKYSRKSSMNSIRHYSIRHDNIPLWVVCDYMNFGQTVTMYRCFDRSLQNSIAKDFTLLAEDCIKVNDAKKFRISPDNLYQIIGSIKDLRNVLAHNNLLFGYCSKTSLPYFEDLHQPLNIMPDSLRKTPYDIFTIMHLFLTDTLYKSYFNEILSAVKRLNASLKSISCNKVTITLGFPEDFWKHSNK